MKIKTIKEYAEEQNVSTRTIFRRIISNQLPSYINVKKLEGRGYVLWYDHCELCNLFEKACREYNQKRIGKGHDPELAAELSIKYKINTARLFRTLGL